MEWWWGGTWERRLLSDMIEEGSGWVGGRSEKWRVVLISGWVGGWVRFSSKPTFGD